MREIYKSDYHTCRKNDRLPTLRDMLQHLIIVGVTGPYFYKWNVQLDKKIGRYLSPQIHLSYHQKVSILATPLNPPYPSRTPKTWRPTGSHTSASLDTPPQITPSAPYALRTSARTNFQKHTLSPRPPWWTYRAGRTFAAWRSWPHTPRDKLHISLQGKQLNIVTIN